MRADLHTHTRASDGTLSPRELVREARAVGLQVLAVTDHDTVDGIAEAAEEAERLGIELVPGVELSTDVPGSEVHILGYFVDWRSEPFGTFLRRLRDGRLARAHEMVRRLNQLGVPLTFEEVVQQADGAVGRPHVARALVAAGYVASFEEAFSRYLARGRPAYVERERFTPEEAVEAILRAGGVPVFAHPLWGGERDRVAGLVERGLVGIEAYYPEHSPQDVRRFLQWAEEFGLVATGGSDYHGPGPASRAPLGSVYVPPGAVDALRAARERAHG